MLVDYVRAYSMPDVVVRNVFYNDSVLDGASAAPGADDDGAIATDKSALRPGQTASFADVTSYSKGINGVMVDVRGLPGGSAGSTAPAVNDFTFRTGAGGDPSAWAAAPTPRTYAIRRGAGVGGADRITFVWDDFGAAGTHAAVANAWLQATVKANDRTGLAAPDVFYFGNLIGETGDAGSPLRVSPTDLAAVRAAPGDASAVSTTADLNRDGRVNP